MFGVDGMSGQNREMTREALDIILRLWGDEPSFEYKGKYWNVTKPELMFGFLKPHIKPLQKPHPRIGVAGLSTNSDTLKMAGEHGFMPLSLNLNPAYVRHPLVGGGGGRQTLRQDPVARRTGAWCARCSSPKRISRRWICRSAA